MTDWTDFGDAFRAALNRIYEVLDAGTGLSMPRSCPACSAADCLHAYFHIGDPPDKTGDGRWRGGSWIWCSGCGRYEHGNAFIPSWWRNAKIVEFDRLTHSPEYLDSIADEIDRHCRELEKG